VSAGEGTIAIGQLNLTLQLSAGIYSGTIQLTGNDAQSNAALSGVISIRFEQTVFRVLLPLVRR
jgi:hypothetical protein